MSSTKSLLALLLFVAGCIPDPGFDEAEIVKTTRVLAVVADPPAVQPGQDSQLRALVVDPEGRPLTFRWSACAQPEFLGGAFSGVQFEGAGNQPDCGDDALRLDLGRSETAVFPGVISEQLFSRLDEAAAVFGDLIRPELIRRIADEVGIAVTVQLEVRAEGEIVVVATKRVLIRSGDLPSTNPWPPEVTVGPEPERVVSARDVFANDEFRCEPEGGESPSVASGGTLTLRPAFDDGAWLETYRVLDPTGEIRELEERAFFSWFVTAGALQEGRTQAPVETNTWTAPRLPGTYPIWVVARDGHGGTAACRFEVAVR